jgi:hypothetical protein
MLEAIADISIWKLLVIGILGFLALVITLGIILSLAAVLGPGMHAVKGALPGSSRKQDHHEESPHTPTGHRLGVMTIWIGIGIVAAVWWKGPELSSLMLTVAILISGGIGLVFGSYNGFGQEIKRQKILDLRHKREMERERERAAASGENFTTAWRQKEADVEANEPEWDRAAAEAKAQEQEWDEKAAYVESKESAPNDEAPGEADEATADIEVETNDEDPSEDDGETDRR